MSAATFRPREHAGRIVLLRQISLIPQWVSPGATDGQAPRPAITAEVVVLHSSEALGGQTHWSEVVINSTVLMRRAMAANGGWVAGRLVMGERAWQLPSLSEEDEEIVAEWLDLHDQDGGTEPPQPTRAQRMAQQARPVIDRRGGAS